MLFTELTDQELKDYSKERCEEIEQMYNTLKQRIMEMITTEDKRKQFTLLADISDLLDEVSFEHLDTLDRYLLVYESNKRLENVITKLKKEEED